MIRFRSSVGIFLALFVTLMLSGCPTTLTPGTPQDTGQPGQENWTTFVEGVPGSILPTILIAFNDTSGSTFNGLLRSTDNGLSWTYCNFVASPGVPGCGGGGNSVPTIPGQQGWTGDPVIVSPSPGVAVYTSLDTRAGCCGGAQLVMASVSIDGGQQFTRTRAVSVGDCASGVVDQPAATVQWDDPNHTIWWVWRHDGNGSAGTYGGCVRGGRVVIGSDGTPDIVFLDDGWTVDNMDREEFGDQWGQGGMLINARTASVGGQPLTRISVMYSNTDHVFSDCSLRSVGWSNVISDDGGNNWYSRVQIAHTSSAYNWCSANGAIQNSLRDFWFTIDPTTGEFWAAVHETPNVIGIYEASGGGASWTRVHEVRWPTGQWLWLPNLAFDGGGRGALSFYSADAPGTTVTRWLASNSTARDMPTAAWDIATVSAGFAPDSGESAAGGDYMSLISLPTSRFPTGDSTFLPVWSQTGDIWTNAVGVTP